MAQVVEAEQRPAERVARPEELVEVGPRDRAGRAGASLLQRARVGPVLGLEDPDLAGGHVRETIPRVPRREHAVEEVDPVLDAAEQVVRRADPHQIAGPLGREGLVGDLERLDHLLLALAEAETADRVSLEPHPGEEDRAGAPEVGVPAALADPEDRLAGSHRDPPAARRPLERALDRLRRRLARRGRRRAHVERHRDVHAEVPLDLHRPLGGEEPLGAVQRRAEPDALVGERAMRGERVDLEAAAVGEDRPVPSDEAVEPAQLTDHRVAGAEPEVEGVAEEDRRAGGAERVHRHRAHGAVGPDRHEGRGLDLPVRRLELARAGAPVAGDEAEGHEERRSRVES